MNWGFWIERASAIIWLRKSEKLLGQLKPALIAKDGRVIDGRARLLSNPNWKVKICEEVDTDEKFEIARKCTHGIRTYPIPSIEEIKECLGKDPEFIIACITR